MAKSDQPVERCSKCGAKAYLVDGVGVCLRGHRQEPGGWCGYCGEPVWSMRALQPLPEWQAELWFVGLVCRLCYEELALDDGEEVIPESLTQDQ